MRILLIDDSTAYQDEFALLLSDGPFAEAKLECATSAAEGAHLMKHGAHEIYFVDFRLPGANGIELIEQARSAGVNQPIILLSGFDDPAIDATASRAGANDFLPKGEFSPEMLGRAIRYALSNAAQLAAAREAENRFRLAQEAANIGTWDWDLRTDAMVWSPRQRVMFGFDPTDTAALTADTWLDAIHPDDHEAALAAVAASVTGHAPFDTLFRILRPDPSQPEAAPEVRWIGGKGLVLREANGVPIRMLGVSVDMTEQQATMDELRSSRAAAMADLRVSENRFQTYFESAADILFHIRVLGRDRFVYEAINPAGLAHTGLSLSAARGRTPEEVLGPEAGALITAGLRQVCRSGRPYSREASIDTSTGGLTYHTIFLPLRDGSGEITGILGSARDISEHRRLEQILRQAQKMESLGQLAGGVAHDFNNILQSITGSLELVLGIVAPQTQVHEFASIGLHAARRGSSLTHKLLSYARRQILRPQVVDLTGLLAGLEEMLARTLGPTISVRMRIAENLPLLRVDPALLESALLNLAINASHAMPAGGSLAIDAREVVERGVSQVAIAVTDTGSGMDEATLARAIEPFFTTKGAKGTGLGLSMVQGFAVQSGGTMRIGSMPGVGTTVELQLPAALNDNVEILAAPLQRHGEAATILLVDDDPDNLLTTGAMLTMNGFKVVSAESGSRALAIIADDARVGAIVSDYVMPGMTGLDVIAAARVERPGLPAMIISGFVNSGERQWGSEGIAFLRKPFQRHELVEALNKLLGVADQRTGTTTVPDGAGVTRTGVG
jgi:PAS domain S-box-containing protein